MSVQHLLAAQDSLAAGYELGTGRLIPTVAIVVGLVSVVAGWRARAGRTGNGRTGAVVAVVTGLASGVVGALHAANAAGGLGTGNGLAGAVVAVVLGVAGAVVGGLTLARSRVTG